MSANNGTAYIGRAMRRRRETVGLPLSAVAECVGVSEATVSRWETGDQAIAWRHIVAVARVLGVTHEDLLAQPARRTRHD